MTGRETLYRLSFLDLVLIVATNGLWVLYVYLFKSVDAVVRP